MVVPCRSLPSVFNIPVLRTSLSLAELSLIIGGIIYEDQHTENFSERRPCRPSHG